MSSPLTIDYFLKAIDQDDVSALREALTRYDEQVVLSRQDGPISLCHLIGQVQEPKQHELLGNNQDHCDRNRLHRDLAYLSANQRALRCLHYLMKTANIAVAADIGVLIAYDQELLQLLIQQHQHREILRSRYDVLNTHYLGTNPGSEIYPRFVHLHDLQNETVAHHRSPIHLLSGDVSECRASSVLLQEIQRLTPHIDWTLDIYAYFLLVSLTLSALKIYHAHVVAPRSFKHLDGWRSPRGNWGQEATSPRYERSPCRKSLSPRGWNKCSEWRPSPTRWTGNKSWGCGHQGWGGHSWKTPRYHPEGDLMASLHDGELTGAFEATLPPIPHPDGAMIAEVDRNRVMGAFQITRSHQGLPDDAIDPTPMMSGKDRMAKVVIGQLDALRERLLKQMLADDQIDTIFFVKAFFPTIQVYGIVPLKLRYRCYLHSTTDYRALIADLEDPNRIGEIQEIVDGWPSQNPGLLALYQRFTGRPVENPHQALDLAVICQDPDRLADHLQYKRDPVDIKRLIEWRYSIHGNWVEMQLARYPQLQPETCRFRPDDLIPTKLASPRMTPQVNVISH